VNGKRSKTDTEQSPAVRRHASRPRVGRNVPHFLPLHYAKSFDERSLFYISKGLLLHLGVCQICTILCQNGRKRLRLTGHVNSFFFFGSALFSRHYFCRSM